MASKATAVSHEKKRDEELLAAEASGDVARQKNAARRMLPKTRHNVLRGFIQAEKFRDVAVSKIAHLMQHSEDERVQLAAAIEILNRSCGKPVTSDVMQRMLDGDKEAGRGGVQITVVQFGSGPEAAAQAVRDKIGPVIEAELVEED